MLVVSSIAAATRIPRHSNWGPAHGAYGDRIVQVSAFSKIQLNSQAPQSFQKIIEVSVRLFAVRTEHVSCSDIVPRTCANFKVDAHVFIQLHYKQSCSLFALARLDEQLAIAN